MTLYIQNYNFGIPIQKLRVEKEVRKFTLFLYDVPHIPRSAVQKIIENVDSIISSVLIPSLLNIVDKELRNEVNGIILAKIKLILQDNHQFFGKFKSDHLRINEYTSAGLLTEPHSFKIADKQEVFINEFSQIIKIPRKIYAVHVPIASTLKLLLEIPGVFKQMESYMKDLSSEKKTISNIIQGSTWQNKYASVDRTIIPGLPFYDDFETGNSLGSHAGEYAIGGVNLLLPCLPPHIVAKMTNIFLATLFYTKDRKDSKNSVVFKKLIEEVNLLFQNGIVIEVDNIKRKIYLECPCLAGDNAALNSACGFPKGFRAKYFCRMCRASSEQCQVMSVEDESLLRNKENYELDLQSQSFGVEEECCFNKMPKFHIAENHCDEIMHNIFEGGAHYSVENVLSKLIFQDKVISLALVNSRIRNFKYGTLESANKPCDVLQDRNDSSRVYLKQSASEMACLARYLPLMIGDVIPKKKKYRYWKTCIVLRQLIGLVTRPSFAKTHITILRRVIANFARIYVVHIGPLPPKFHFITHTPTMIEENGPPVHLSAMPFERKNKEMKELAKTTTSRRNLLKTIAIRNQLKLAYLEECAIDCSTSITFGPSKMCNVQSKIRKIDRTIMKDASSAFEISYVSINGYKYSEGSIFVYDVAEEPNFAYLLGIFRIKETVYFYGYIYETEYFDSYYHAYKVSTCKVPNVLMNIDSIPKVPSALVVEKKGGLFISTRYD